MWRMLMALVITLKEKDEDYIVQIITNLNNDDPEARTLLDLLSDARLTTLFDEFRGGQLDVNFKFW